MFERKSQIIIEGDKAKEDDLMNLVLEAGADDLRNEGRQLGNHFGARYA